MNTPLLKLLSERKKTILFLIQGKNQAMHRRVFYITFSILAFLLIGLIIMLQICSYNNTAGPFTDLYNQTLTNKKQQQEADKQEKINFINKLYALDLYSDTSLYKIVDNKIAFDTLSYVPKSLVGVAGEYIVDSKGGYIQVREETKKALDIMAKDFYNATTNKLVIVSGYRSYTYQKGIKDRGCPDNLCAKAGFSEHQSGLAVDLYSASSQQVWKADNNLRQYYQWLNENAHNYGFTNTYQKGREIDGYEVEPWHWRYVGTFLASYLKESDMTLAEFYYSNVGN